MMGCGWPVQVRPSHMCYLAKYGRSRSDSTSVITEIRWKILTLASRLSRSLKLTRIDRRQFWSKIANFSHHRVFNAPLGSFHCNYVRVVGLKNWNDGELIHSFSARYQIAKNCDDMCIRLDTIPALDRQTDRRNELLKQYRVVHAQYSDAR